MIDEQVGRAIQSGNKRCRKYRNDAIPFSEAFRIARDERWLWLLVLRKKYGQRVSSTTIRRLAARLKEDNPLSIDFIEVKYKLKIATIEYHEVIKNARSERDKFIDSLADANSRAEKSQGKRYCVVSSMMKSSDFRTQN